MSVSRSTVRDHIFVRFGVEGRTVVKWHLEASACNNAVIPDTTENERQKKDKSLYQTGMAGMEDRQEQ